MKDDRLQTVLDAWFTDRDETAPDARGDIARVMADVPRTRQHGRWWRLPAFDRPASTFPVRAPAQAPARIPATDGPLPVRGSTVFSALRFAVAGVIVALFGGFLLTGILATPQQDAVLPAAVTESPSPTTTEELLSGMVTEETEPGVYRVMNDGVRDLTPGSIEHLAVGTDGSVWAFGVDGFRRLGREQPEEMEAGTEIPPHDDFGVGPDGTLWLDGAHWGPDPWAGLASFDGEHWTRHRPDAIPDDHRPWGLHVAPDGSVWVLLGGRGQWQSREALLARLDGDGWEITDFVPRAFPELFAGGPSSVWAVEENVPPPRVPELHRFDDGRWVQQHVPAYLPRPWELVAGLDDTLWIRSWRGEVAEPATQAMSMAHFDGSEWRLWDEAHFPTEGDTNLLWAFQPMAAGADGSLWGEVLWGTWASPSSEEWPEPVCDGIARFDGTTVRRYLEGLCVRMLDAAPDGSVWVLAGDEWDGGDLVDAYVITPEAVTAAE